MASSVRSKWSALVALLLLPTLFFGRSWRCESEHLYARDACSRVIRDTTASNDSCRVAYAGIDSRAHMQYGPNILFPPGYYVATFRMKLGSTRTSINGVCMLDITSRRVYPLRYHAMKKVNASYFAAPLNWQDFKMAFFLRDTVDCFQLRIEWLDSADLYVDYVEVTAEQDTTMFVYAVNLQDLDLDLVTDPFDFRMADRRLLIASIQGAVNRERPRMVLLHSDGDYEAQGIHRWLQSLDVRYILLTYDECLDKLVRPGLFKGCVLFDPGAPDSSAIKDPPAFQGLLFQVKAIATNLAALESLLIVTPRTRNDIDLRRFPIRYDLTDRRSFPFLRDPTGGRAFDYNLHLFETRRFSRDLAFKLFPYMSASPLRNAAEKLTDYAIRNRCWCFYGDLRDATDNDLLQRAAIGPVRYLMGYCDEGLENGREYYCREYEHIKLASEAGKLWIGSMGRIHNLSFFAALQTGLDIQPSKPAVPPLEDKIYICFLSMDGDNPLLLLKHYRKDWDSPLRGRFAVSWGFPPKLLDIAPSILQYYYDNRTVNDCIIADISGLAWHLTNRFEFGYFPGMLDIAAEYLRKTDMRVVKLMADRNTDLADVDYLQRFVVSYPEISGFVEGYWPPQKGAFMMVRERYPSVRLAINKPIVGLGDQLGVSSIVQAVEELVLRNKNRPLFVPVVYNIYNPAYTISTTLYDKLDSIVSILDRTYGARVSYVRADVMIELVKEYYRVTNSSASLLSNRGFEDELKMWRISGNVRVDHSMAHGGKASALVGRDASAWQAVSVGAGKTYRAKVWLLPDGLSTAILRIAWHTSKQIGCDTVFCYRPRTTVGDWLFYFRDLIAPPGATSARVICEARGDRVWYDDVDLKEVQD